jgi:cellulose 1,4-beta-cellobiosidase
LCDKDGCDFNPYRMGNTSFYGPGKTIDTKQKMTVVTQFITNDKTDTGTLTEIRRIYKQGNRVVQNTVSNIAGVDSSNSLTEKFCTQQKSVFKDNNDFSRKGGLAAMGNAMGRGMVLVMSIWDDYSAGMLWLDGTYPVGGSGPGVVRGTCDATSGLPSNVESQHGDASVTFSNIKVGTIGSTYS